MCFHIFHPLLPSFREGVAGMGCQRRAKDLKELERLEEDITCHAHYYCILLSWNSDFRATWCGKMLHGWISALFEYHENLLEYRLHFLTWSKPSLLTCSALVSHLLEVGASANSKSWWVGSLVAERVWTPRWLASGYLDSWIWFFEFCSVHSLWL